MVFWSFLLFILLAVLVLPVFSFILLAVLVLPVFLFILLAVLVLPVFSFILLAVLVLPVFSFILLAVLVLPVFSFILLAVLVLPVFSFILLAVFVLAVVLPLRDILILLLCACSCWSSGRPRFCVHGEFCRGVPADCNVSKLGTVTATRYVCHWRSSFFEELPLVEFMFFVFTRMPGENHRRRLRSSLLCLCDAN